MQFESIEELKQQVGDTLKDLVETPLNTIGYIEPGHWAKGKQRWLSTDQDLIDMFARNNVKFFFGAIRLLQAHLLLFDVKSVHILKNLVLISNELTRHPVQLNMTISRTTRYDHH